MNSKDIRLGVNIDHVATIRQARAEVYPSLEQAAEIALKNGADQITIHLREDRRHIQDQDVWEIKKITDRWQRPLNLELGCAKDIVQIAKDVKANWYCIVPERREERTTEGGLDLEDQDNFKKIERTCNELKNAVPGCKISLFVAADKKTLEKCNNLPIDAVEIHTGDFAHAFNAKRDYQGFIEGFKFQRELIKKYNLGYHAGHGLTEYSLIPLLENNLFEEYNIGHWIIAQSLFEGLGVVVGRLNQKIKDRAL